MNKRRTALVVIGIIYIAICVGLYVYLYTIPNITGAMTPTETITYGRMKIDRQAECFVVRSEELVYSQDTGNVSYYVDENIKTRRGQKVLDIYTASGSVAYYMPRTGVVSYYTDGFEDLLTPGAIELLDPEALTSLEFPVSEIKPASVEKGDALYKLIDSDVWYMVLVVPSEDLPNYSTGAAVTVTFSEGEAGGDVYGIYERGESAMVVVKTGRYFDFFTKLRRETVTVTAKDSSGLIVPNSAICTVDGYRGVYVVEVDGGYTFTRVNVLFSDGERSLVSSDYFNERGADGTTSRVNSVSVYDEILKEGLPEDSDGADN